MFAFTQVVWEDILLESCAHDRDRLFGDRRHRIIEQGTFDTPARSEALFQATSVPWKVLGIQAEVEIQLARGAKPAREPH